MPDTELILVTGASGHVGGELVARLAAAGHRVRAMTRKPHDLAVPDGVEVVGGDADDPTSLVEAFDGVDRAFLMSAEVTGSAARPTQIPRLVDAAAGAGAEHVVLLSVYGADTRDDALADWHRRIEDAVTVSGMDWTLLRPGRFMSNALQWAPQIRRGDQVAIPFTSRPAASIDPADIAAVAAVALTTDDHRGAAHRMSGPQVLTPVQELAVLAALLERPLHAVEPPPDAVRAGMARSGMSVEVLDAVLARTLDTDEGTQLLPTVEDVLGRPPATFTEWAARHRHRFVD
jgi:uncharacterized protein YbjT (DUF2867 family)